MICLCDSRFGRRAEFGGEAAGGLGVPLFVSAALFNLNMADSNTLPRLHLFPQPVELAYLLGAFEPVEVGAVQVRRAPGRRDGHKLAASATLGRP